MNWYQQRQTRTSTYLRGLSAGQQVLGVVLAIVTVLVINIALSALFGDGVDWFNAVASAIGFGLVMAVILRPPGLQLTRLPKLLRTILQSQSCPTPTLPWRSLAHTDRG